MKSLNTQEFFTLLYKDAPRDLFLHTWRKRDARVLWIPSLSDTVGENLTSYTLGNQKEDIYFGIGLSREAKPKGRPENDEIEWIPGLWLDLDWSAEGAHAKGKAKLPPDKGAAFAFLQKIPLKPTFLVNSGYGFHVYWQIAGGFRLNDDIRILEKWQKFIKGLAKESGYDLDSTFDAARVYRIPGSMNWKTGNPQKCLVEDYSGMQYQVSAFSAYTEPKSEHKTERKERKKRVAEEKANADLIYDRCGWMKSMKDHPEEADEPSWFGMMSVLGGCENGEELAHEWSSGHPKYNYAETQKKYLHVVEKDRPRTCSFISSNLGGSPHCDNCQYNGKITSPIVLGKDKVGEFAERYIYVKDLVAFYDKETNRVYDPQQIRNNHKTFVKKMDELLLETPTVLHVDGLTYWPGQELIVQENRKTCVNLWKPYYLEPKEGDTHIFDNHIAWLIKDEDVREKMLDCFAFVVQKPGEKMNFAMFIGGEPGIGKSYLNALFRAMMGSENCCEITTEELVDSFNGWFTQGQLFVVEEVYGAGKKEISNKLKTLITSEKIYINEKNIRRYEMVNRANFLMFSNHENAISIEDGDRRYFVHWSDGKAAEKNEKYYETLFKDIEINGGAILHKLLSRDISKFNPKGRAPETEIKKFIIDNSKPDWEQFVDEQIAYENSPFESGLITFDEMTNYVKGRGYNVSRSALARYARKKNWQSRTQVIIDGKRHTVYCWKNNVPLSEKSTEELRKLLDASENPEKDIL